MGDRTSLVELRHICLACLEQGRLLETSVVGGCMSGLIDPGDIVMVAGAPLEKVTVGDIVVFASGGDLICHRVVRVSPSGDEPFVVTRGDWLFNVDHPITRESFVGIVVAVRKGDRILDLSAPDCRLLSRTVELYSSVCYHLRRGWRVIARVLRWFPCVGSRADGISTLLYRAVLVGARGIFRLWLVARREKTFTGHDSPAFISALVPASATPGRPRCSTEEVCVGPAEANVSHQQVVPTEHHEDACAEPPQSIMALGIRGAWAQRTQVSLLRISGRIRRMLFWRSLRGSPRNCRHYWDWQGRRLGLSPLQYNQFSCAPDRHIELAARLGISPGKRLLEIGCGAGALMEPLSILAGYTVGVDFSLPMLKRCSGVTSRVGLCAGNAVSLPFRDGSFDIVLCYSVLHYLPNIGAVIQAVYEAIRVCAPGGTVYFGDNERATGKAVECYRGSHSGLPCLRLNEDVFGLAAHQAHCDIQLLPALYGSGMFDVQMRRRT